MMKTQVGIGSLSIPGAFEILGLIPGVLVLTIVAILATWSNHTAGNFSIRHPEVFSLDQAGKTMYGRLGEYVFLTCLMLPCVLSWGHKDQKTIAELEVFIIRQSSNGQDDTNWPP